MLKINRLTDYATLVMTYLVSHPGPHNARDIAEHSHLNLPTVTKLLKILTNNNLLASSRGVNGGYSLARAASDISVAEIIQAIEGDWGLTECSHTDSQCTLEPLCSTRKNWRFISGVIYNALQNVSLAQMAGPLANSMGQHYER